MYSYSVTINHIGSHHPTQLGLAQSTHMITFQLSSTSVIFPLTYNSYSPLHKLRATEWSELMSTDNTSSNTSPFSFSYLRINEDSFLPLVKADEAFESLQFGNKCNSVTDGKFKLRLAAKKSKL